MATKKGRKAALKAWATIRHRKQFERAVFACEQLVEAYDAGERNGGSVEWSDVDAAYHAARMALGLK